MQGTRPQPNPAPVIPAPLWIVQQGLHNPRPVKSERECDPESMGVGATKGTRSSPAVYSVPPENLRRQKVCSKTSLQLSYESTVVVPAQTPLSPPLLPWPLLEACLSLLPSKPDPPSLVHALPVPSCA